MAEVLHSSFRQAGLNLDLRKQFHQEVDTWRIRFHSSRMLQLGLTEQEVIRYLESITRGSFVTDWNQEDERIEIRMIGEDQGVYSTEHMILRFNGREVPLSYIASM